ncbi:hypothetical protein GCM10008966_30400 [Rhodovulum strictum]
MQNAARDICHLPEGAMQNAEDALQGTRCAAQRAHDAVQGTRDAMQRAQGAVHLAEDVKSAL